MKRIIIVLFFLSTACIESRTDNYSFIENKTNHNISINPYLAGNISTSLVFEIGPHEKKLIDYISYGGAIGNGFSYGSTITFQDSILVIFDHKDTILHYKPTLIGSAKRFYPFSSPRNLYNEANYIKTAIEKTSYSSKHYFLYTFTEQDYLDAKQ
jgi:hypothetical protein